MSKTQPITIDEFITQHDLVMLPIRLQSRTDGTEWIKMSASHWRCNLWAYDENNTQSFEYSMGNAHTDAPELVDVLRCLASDAQSVAESFDDWCANFGYDTDSRKTLATYEACRANGAKLERVLGTEAYNQLLDYDSVELD